KNKLEGILPFYLMHSRWFAGKEKKPKAARIVETLPLQEDHNPCICIIEVEYDEGEPDRYALPLGFFQGETARAAKERTPERVLAELGLTEKSRHVDGVVCDAMADPTFGRLLLDVFERRRRVKGKQGEMVATLSRNWRKLRGSEDTPIEPRW